MVERRDPPPDRRAEAQEDAGWSRNTRPSPEIGVGHMAVDEVKLNDRLGKFVVDAGASFHAVNAVIGDRLGLYRALLAVMPASPAEVAGEVVSGSYVREWLAEQAAGGYITYDADTERFSLARRAGQARDPHRRRDRRRGLAAGRALRGAAAVAGLRGRTGRGGVEPGRSRRRPPPDRRDVVARGRAFDRHSASGGGPARCPSRPAETRDDQGFSE